MRVGFIHGVMNTDNTAISGETIDYGPCAMMSSYDPRTVFSSIDHGGRYAYGNQPTIVAWNLTRLAECLLPLVAPDQDAAIERLNPKLDAIQGRFERSWLRMMGRKLGLAAPGPDDVSLVTSLLEQMQREALDFTVLFERLRRSLDSADEAAALKQDLGEWYERWRARLDDQPAALPEVAASMSQHSPVVIPRNHHVEAAIARCTETLDPAPAERLLEVLRAPHEALPRTAEYQDPPADGDRNYRTFCGT